MATDTIPEDATQEQLDDYVSQLAAEAEEDRQGESSEKDDAQITSEHADNEKKPAPETKSGGDTADVEPDNVGSEDSEKTGKADSAWRKEAKAEAAAYGIGKEELAEFQSREELDRALKLFDKQLDSERDKLLKDEKDKGVESKEDRSAKDAE